MSHMQSSSFFKRGRIAGGLGFIVVASAVALLLLTSAALAGVRWGSTGAPVCSEGHQQWAPLVCSDGYNGAIVTWGDNRSGDWDIYAQHLTSGGSVDPTWPADGVAVCVVAGSNQLPTAIVSDGAHGALITWYDPRLTPSPMNAVYVQHVLGLGHVDTNWTPNGNRVSDETINGAEERAPRLASDTGGAAIVCWRYFDTSTYQVMAQRLLSNGATNWAGAGIAISSAPGIQDLPEIVSDGNEGAIISFSNNDIYAQRMDNGGNRLWTPTGVAICSATGLQESAALVSDGGNGAIVAWSDDRSGTNRDLYAQRVIPGGGTTGQVVWAANGVPVCAGQAGTFPRAPKITTDGSGGAVIAWVDDRSGGTSREIFSQRVTSAAGDRQWTANGVLLCNAGSLQEDPQIASDMDHGAIVTWKDTRPPGPSAIVNAYAQRVNGGAVKWAPGAVRLCIGGQYQLVPQIVSDGQYGAIIPWEDWRAGLLQQDIYAQRVSNDAPTVAGISPNSGFNNTTVHCTITGTGFTPSGASGALQGSTIINGTNNVIVNDTTFTCDFDLNGQPFGLYDVYVFSGDGQVASAAGLFVVRSTVPVISGVNPTNASPGQVLTITGGGFGDTMGSGKYGVGASYVTFGTVQATEYPQWTDTQIQVMVPQGATTCGVTVTNASGTSNSAAIKVVYPIWYLAEGSTNWGFSTYITIENPNNTTVTARMRYMPTGAANVTEDLGLPPNSQTTVSNDHLVQVMGGARDFSTQVTCNEGLSIAVDRTMSWTGPGAKSPEGHASVGVNAPAYTWYLPEGSTAWGFETWLLIQNPNGVTANCQVTYMIEGEGPRTFTKQVGSNSRETFDVSKDIGAKDASIKVVSDVPVIPERAMYRNNRREGHESIGTTATATDYFLAEGAVGYASGFTTWVLVQNPQSTPTNVNITYMTQNGSVTGPAFQMAANTRKTIRVNDQLPVNTDVSTLVHGSQPIIAERAMYWGANSSLGEACHDSIGLDFPHMTFYLPDGQSSFGYETWTLVQNPNPGAVTVQISYLAASGAGNVTFTDEIAAGSRKTYNMADKLSGRASVMVQSLDGARPVMVERSMYWNNRGAGTDTIGGYSD